MKQGLVVKIPAAVAGKTGSPTGTIFNGSPTDFLLGPGAQAVFLFSTIDGTIAGWNPASGLEKGQKPPRRRAPNRIEFRQEYSTDSQNWTVMAKGLEVKQ